MVLFLSVKHDMLKVFLKDSVFSSHTESLSSGCIKFPYREAVGCLMYLAIATRSDIAYAVGVVSRYLDSPNQVHINAII